jgi:hypothetical protein
MMEFDRAAEHIGQGIMLNDLKFNTWIERRNDSSLGFRVKKKAHWKTLFLETHWKNNIQYQCVEQFFGQFGIPLKPIYYGTTEMDMLITMINTANKIYRTREAFGDQDGLHMVEWVIDNPMPTDNMDNLKQWAEYYDDERESLGQSGDWATKVLDE